MKTPQPQGKGKTNEYAGRGPPCARKEAFSPAWLSRASKTSHLNSASCVPTSRLGSVWAPSTQTMGLALAGLPPESLAQNLVQKWATHQAKGIRRWISAAIYVWDPPLQTFIYPGFECGSPGFGRDRKALDQKARLKEAGGKQVAQVR